MASVVDCYSYRERGREKEKRKKELQHDKTETLSVFIICLWVGFQPNNFDD